MIPIDPHECRAAPNLHDRSTDGVYLYMCIHVYIIGTRVIKYFEKYKRCYTNTERYLELVFLIFSIISSTAFQVRRVRGAYLGRTVQGSANERAGFSSNCDFVIEKNLCLNAIGDGSVGCGRACTFFDFSKRFVGEVPKHRSFLPP